MGAAGEGVAGAGAGGGAAGQEAAGAAEAVVELVSNTRFDCEMHPAC